MKLITLIALFGLIALTFSLSLVVPPSPPRHPYHPRVILI